MISLSGGPDSNRRSSPWQGDILPLNYHRKILIFKPFSYTKHPSSNLVCCFFPTYWYLNSSVMCQVPESNRNLLFFRQSPWPPWLTWLMRLFYHVLWIRQDLNLWPSGPACRVGDRWWIWTTNLLDVNQTLYRWAKRSLWRAGCKPGALANWATDPKKYQNSVRMRGFEPPRTKASTGSSSLSVYRFQHIRST